MGNEAVETGTSETDSNNEEVLETQTSDNEGASVKEGTPTEEKWVVPGRFKTAEDILKSYQSIESEYSRTKNELQRLKHVGTQNGGTAEQRRDKEWLARRIQEDPIKAIREAAGVDDVQKTIQEISWRNEYAVRQSNPEFKELEPDMARLAEENMDLINQYGLRTEPRLMDLLFWVAKGQKQTQAVDSASKKAKRQGELDASKKSRMQIEGGSSSSNNNDSFEKLSLDEKRKRILSMQG